MKPIPPKRRSAAQTHSPTASPSVRGMQRVDLAYAQLASSETARDINRDIVLELIRTHQPISRADLSRISGLQRSTVSLIVDQLIDEQWIVEGATTKLPRGRHPTMLLLNDAITLLAVDIRPRHAALAVVDLNGHFLSTIRLPITTDAKQSIAAVMEGLKQLKASMPHKSFQGVGVSMPGRIDPQSQRLVFNPNLAWSDFDIKGAIQAGIGLPVELDNAANTCLLAEAWFGHLNGIRNAVLVAVVEGVGTALLSNGQLLHGQNGMAGEFGHLPYDPSGPQCSCGRRGCWELYASSNAALRHYAALSGRKLDSVQDLLRLSQEGEAQAVEAVTWQIGHVSRGLQMICTALAPEIILITGDIVPLWPKLRKQVEADLGSFMLAGQAPRVIASYEAEEGRLRGAAVLVLQRQSRSFATA